MENYKYRENHPNSPSFQTWLHLLRNTTARGEFSQLIADNYFVEVDMPSIYDWSEDINLDLTTLASSNSKDVIGFETLKRINVDSDEEESASVTEVKSSDLTDGYGEEIVNKEASKFDRVVDDKQYVEKPVILEELQTQNDEPKEDLNISITAAQANVDSASKDKREEDINIEENETVREDEKIRKYNENMEKLIMPIREVLESNEPEKLTLPLQKLDGDVESSVFKEPGEIMLAMESHISSVRQVSGKIFQISQFFYNSV